jgi:hypothetical protein
MGKAVGFSMARMDTTSTRPPKEHIEVPRSLPQIGTLSTLDMSMKSCIIMGYNGAD